MTDTRRQSSTGPAWGEAHLALDAVVAYVDDELSPGARRRALSHLAGCPECACEVIAQTQTRLALRAASTPMLPSSLLSSLRAIPQEAELPEPPAGLAVGPRGELVTMLRAVPSPVGSTSPADRPDRRRLLDRRVRLGAGAIVSGLALGALMVSGTPNVGVSPSSPMPRSTLDARMQLGTAVRDTARDTPTRRAVLSPNPSLAPSVAPAVVPAVRVAGRPETVGPAHEHVR